MQMYELQPLVSSIYLRDKESWEQTRFLSYIMAQVNSTKKMKLTDIMSFPWENEEDNTKEDTTISNDDIERLRNKAKQYLKKK